MLSFKYYLLINSLSFFFKQLHQIGCITLPFKQQLLRPEIKQDIHVCCNRALGNTYA